MAIKDTFEDRRARGSSGNLAWSMPAGWCIVFDPTNARRGDWALHWEGSSDPAPAYLKEELSVSPGERVQAFGFAKRVTGSNAAGRIQVSWRDAAGAEISVSAGSSVTAGSYGQSRLLEEAPAGSVSARLLADVDGTSGNAHEIFFDDVLVQVVTQDSDVNWSGINDDGGKPQDFADVTGDTLLAGLLPNWSLSIADSSGLPAGIQPIQGIADRSQLSFIDSSNLGMRLLSAPEAGVAYGWPAIPIDDRAVYTVSIRHRSETTSAEGYYLRLNEIAGPLADGETHVSVSNRTSSVDLVVPNGPVPGPAYITSTYTYTPTPGTDFASFGVWNWSAYSGWVDVKWVSISTRASAALGADVTGDNLSLNVSIRPVLGITWVLVDGNTVPSQTTVDRDVEFTRNGIVASRTVRCTRDGSNNLTWSSVSSSGETTTFSTAGSGTKSCSCTVGHTASGEKTHLIGLYIDPSVGTPSK